MSEANTCWNCSRTETPKWRSSKRWAVGHLLCNGCGTRENRGGQPTRQPDPDPVPVQPAVPVQPDSVDPVATPLEPGMLFCPACKLPLPEDNFGLRNMPAKGGTTVVRRQSWCRECRKRAANASSEKRKVERAQRR